jgi:hypothetical protein
VALAGYSDVKLSSVAAALLLGNAFSLSGCNLSIPGTTAAYDKCYRALKAQNLDDNAAKISCISSNQARISRGLTGTAGPEKYGDTNFDFDASIANDSTDLVVTSFQIVVTLPDGKQVSKTFQGQFIQPGQFQHFGLSANEMKGIYFTDFTKDANDKPLWTWFVEPLTGLTIFSYWYISTLII